MICYGLLAKRVGDTKIVDSFKGHGTALMEM